MQLKRFVASLRQGVVQEDVTLPDHCESDRTFTIIDPHPCIVRDAGLCAEPRTDVVDGGPGIGGRFGAACEDQVHHCLKIVGVTIRMARRRLHCRLLSRTILFDVEPVFMFSIPVSGGWRGVGLFMQG
jgi:hypothetical protein